MQLAQEGISHMVGKKKDPLTAAEWKVMKIIWSHGDCAARDVYELAGEEHGWSPSTVKTILRRLAEKGHVRTRRVGNSFLYKASRPALKSLYSAADNLLANAVEGTVGPLLAYIVRRGDLTAEDLEELRSLLNEIEPRQKENE